jgi:hypothetical protein
MGRSEMHTGFWWENLRERDHLEGPGVVGRIILKWIFEKWDGEPWTGLVGCCVCGNEPSDSTKCGKFSEYLKTC